MTESVALYSLLADHPNTRALRRGELSSSLVAFDFIDASVANRHFKAMVRELKFDFGELALVTALQAKVYGKPYALLPATLVGRYQHHTIFYNADRGPLTARDLNGKRVGVRAYSQTTGAWVRGFLAEDYGIDIGSVTWVTLEGAHVAEYRDPANVERAPEGGSLKQMLCDGEIDAAILGDLAEEAPLKRLIPDHETAAREHALKHGGVPINHLAIVRESLVQSHPEVVREIYRLLKESRAEAGCPATGPEDPLRFGVDAVGPSIEYMVEIALNQGLIPHRLSVDDLFADVVRALGADAA